MLLLPSPRAIEEPRVHADAPLARLDDVPPGAIYEVEHEGRSLLVVNAGGQIHVIDALCTHLEGPLSQGAVDGDVIACPWHGARFDLATGAPVHRPATRPLATYEVQIDGDEIRIRESLANETRSNGSGS
jgi:nitrite reductase/ring-hydroxylating ferredoxin subunit